MIVPPSVIARSIFSITQAVKRYPGERKARREAEDRFNRTFAQEEQALDKLLAEQFSHLTIIDVTNALGMYMHSGETIVQAMQSYRYCLIEGRKLPGTERTRQEYGYRLRQKLNALTPFDEKYAKRMEIRRLARGRLFVGAIFLLSGWSVVSFSDRSNTVGRDLAYCGLLLGALLIYSARMLAKPSGRSERLGE